MIYPTKLGGFQLGEPLGRPGGFGVAWRAEREGEQFVVKVMHSDALTGVDARRFDREVRALQIDHPNLVRYEDCGHDQVGGREWHWIAMPYLSGRSLRDELLAAGGGLGAARAMEIARQCAEGLAALHETSVVHRDIKPENIYVCDDGRVVLLDFGISLFVDSTTITQAGNWVGTLLYAPPEQLSGNSVPASDLYSLGAVLYEMLTGRPAVTGDSLAAVFHAIHNASPGPPSAHAAGVTAEIDALVESLLEKEPMDRPGDALAVAAALRPRLHVPKGVARTTYPRDHSPRIWMRVRSDVYAATDAALAGSVPDALIVSLGDQRIGKSLGTARAAANHHAIGFGVDTQLMRCAYTPWASTSWMREAAYRPPTAAPYTPEDFRTQDAVAELAHSTIAAQADTGVNFAFSAAFPVTGLEDPWVSRNAALLERSIEAAKGWDLKLWATLAVDGAVLCSENRQTRLANDLIRGEPDGFYVNIDGLDSKSGVVSAVFGARFGVLLMERGVPVVMARASAQRRFLTVFGLGCEIGLGRYDGFHVAYLRSPGGGSSRNPSFEIPELLSALTPEHAANVLRTELTAACECSGCRDATTVEERLARAAEHNAWVALSERDALARIPVAQRANDLRASVREATSLERRLRRTGALPPKVKLDHLRVWPAALDEARSLGMLNDQQRLPRRRSA